MKKYQKFGTKKDFIKKVLSKKDDLQTGKIIGSGTTAKSCNDKDGNVQHSAGMDVQR